MEYCSAYVTTDGLVHYGRKGMKWYQHIFGDRKSREARSAKRILEKDSKRDRGPTISDRTLSSGTKVHYVNTGFKDGLMPVSYNSVDRARNRKDFDGEERTLTLAKDVKIPSHKAFSDAVKLVAMKRHAKEKDFEMFAVYNKDQLLDGASSMFSEHPDFKRQVAAELKRNGYNGMPDVKRVMGFNGLARKGVDPILLFVDDSLFSSEMTIDKDSSSAKKKATNEYYKWKDRKSGKYSSTSFDEGW